MMDGNYELPLKGPIKLQKLATQAVNEGLQHYELVKRLSVSPRFKHPSLRDVLFSISILRHTLQHIGKCFSVADVTSSQFLIAGICKSDLLVAANRTPVSGLNASAMTAILKKAKTNDLQLTFLAVRKGRQLAGISKSKSDLAKIRESTKKTMTQLVKFREANFNKSMAWKTTRQITQEMLKKKST